MITRRLSLTRMLVGLAAAVGLKAAPAKRIYADPLPGDKFQPTAADPPPFDPVTIGMRFLFEGRRYGLRVPVLGEIEDYVDGDRVVIMSDDQVAILIRMLQDLRTSNAETLRLLEAGEAIT